MQNPCVSVIVPCYNASVNISRCLFALVNQTISSIEIICIDDGSQDNSVEVINQYVQAYPDRVRLIQNQHQGASKARESGMLVASGDYIGFCDADDFVDHSMYELMHTRAESDGSDIVVCAYDRIVDDKVVATEMNSFGDRCMAVSSNSGWFTCVNTGLCNKLFKREVLEKRLSLETPPRVMEDAMILLSLLPSIRKISFCHDSLYYYCTLKTSSMSYLNEGDLPVIIDSWKRVKSFVMSKDESYLDVVDLMAFVHLGVSAPLRMLGMPKAQMRESYQVVLNALDESFSSYANSKFLQKSYVKIFSGMRKVAFAYRFHKAKMMLPALQAYRALTALLHFDLKW